MNELMPSDRLYNTNYSWIKISEGIAVIGVTKVFVTSVKEFVFIDLPKLGEIKKGDTYVSLESVKWSGHLGSPLTGEIIEVNDPLFDDPEKLNADPYVNWIMKLKLSNSEETKELFDADTAIAKSTCQVH